MPRHARHNIHPGEILREEFLIPLGLTEYRLAKSIGVAPTRINQIIKEQRALTPDTALRLDRVFGLSDGFWMNLQVEYDMRRARATLGSALRRIQPFATASAKRSRAIAARRAPTNPGKMLPK